MARSRFGFLREWRAMRAFGALDPSFREIVFYSEGSGDWPHLGPVVECLLGEHGQKLSYLTSDPNDPGLATLHPNLRSFDIGAGTMRTILFRSIDCRHFVMTLPDLETFHLKRSVRPVHYVYLFHSINSTHTAYRKGAFDHYDTILCVGPHHADEIRKTEQVYGLPAKELVEHGSVKLDTVLAQTASLPPQAPKSDGPREVLIAPTWGDSSLIEQPLGEELIDVVLNAGHRAVLRLHPMTVRRLPKLIDGLERKHAGNPRFVVEKDMNATASWMRSDVMVSDWSGAAIEYAFSLQKPVVYVSTQQKINNPEWQKIGAPSFEDRIRFEIGQVVERSAIATLPERIEESCRKADAVRAQILSARERWIYNVGRSSQAAAEYLLSLVRP